MFAQSLFEFGLPETVFNILRVIAAVGGAVVGWFLFDPVTRIVYRASFKGSAPSSVLFGSKFTGAAACAVLVFVLMQQKGGYGPGLGGGPGKGPGPGGGDKGVISNDGVKDGKPTPKDKVDAAKKPPNGIEPIEIEIISIKRFDDIENERYFLLKRAEPPFTPVQLEDYFKKNHARIEVTPVLTIDSIGDMADDNPHSQLLALTKKYSVKTLQTKRP